MSKGRAALVVFELIVGLLASVLAGASVYYSHNRVVLYDGSAVPAMATPELISMDSSLLLTPKVPTATATDVPTVVSLETVSVTPTLTPSSASTISPTLTVQPTATRGLALATPVPVATARPTLAGHWNLVSRCGFITAPGNYRLAGDLLTEGDCINIQSNQVVVDCENHIIQGSARTGVGIGIRNYGPMGLSSSDSVEIRNCRISKFRFGIFVEGGKNHLIWNNNSSDNYDDTDSSTRAGVFLGMVEGGGIHIKNTSESQVIGNVTSHEGIGIDVRNSSNMIVRGNTSSDNSAWGINLFATQNSQISGNVTADNVRTCQWGGGTVGLGCDAGGIVLQGGSSNNVISNNRVTGKNGNGIFIKAHAQPCGNDNSIVGNTITSVLYNAVELSFCNGNRIADNVMQDGLDGIWLGYAHRTEIRNNAITGMRNHGIISSNSRDNVISGNQIVNSNEGMFFYSEDVDTTMYSWLPFGDYKSHDNCLCGNRLEGNLTVGIRLKDSTANQVTDNTFQSNGRNLWLQGKSDGNKLQDGLSWLPGVLGPATAVARH